MGHIAFFKLRKKSYKPGHKCDILSTFLVIFFFFQFNAQLLQYCICRPGSIITEFKLTFKTQVITRDALAPLRKVMATGNLGSLHVDKTSLKVLQTVETGESRYGFIKMYTKAIMLFL